MRIRTFLLRTFSHLVSTLPLSVYQFGIFLCYFFIIFLVNFFVNFFVKNIFSSLLCHFDFKYISNRFMDHFFSNLVVSNVRFRELAVIMVLAIHDRRRKRKMLRPRILLMKWKLMKWKLKG